MWPWIDEIPESVGIIKIGQSPSFMKNTYYCIGLKFAFPIWLFPNVSLMLPIRQPAILYSFLKQKRLSSHQISKLIIANKCSSQKSETDAVVIQIYCNLLQINVTTRNVYPSRWRMAYKQKIMWRKLGYRRDLSLVRQANKRLFGTLSQT